MSKWTEWGNNAIAAMPTVDSKGQPLDWNENQKRAYRRANAKSWAKAFLRIPNFKSMKAEEIDAWHDKQAEAGQKIRELEAHRKDKAAKKTRSRKSA